MLSHAFIILFVFLPTGLTYAANPKTLNQESLEKYLSQNPKDSSAFFNLSLLQNKKKQLGSALANSERSLFLNPLNFKARSLKTNILESIKDKSSKRLEEVPILHQIFDFLPSTLLFTACLVSLLGFALKLGKLRHKELKTFKNQPEERLNAGLIFALFLCLSALFISKSYFQNQTWACITSDSTPLHTGPATQKFPQVSTLNEGDCARVIFLSKNWVSLKPQYRNPGWTQKAHLLIVRGNKFDPLFNKD
jgi:hypothetical protein